jgi:hypothetical protein
MAGSVGLSIQRLGFESPTLDIWDVAQRLVQRTVNPLILVRIHSSPHKPIKHCRRCSCLVSSRAQFDSACRLNLGM